MEKEFDLSKLKGLTSKEAAGRLEKEGYNELPVPKKRNILSIFIAVIREPMLLLLLGSGGIYFLLGSIEDAWMLLTFIFFVVGITFYQERKTERALEALKNLASPRAMVIRDAAQVRIAGREVVKEDILILNEGDRVPADAVILNQTNLSVDESLLTGESAAVRKSTDDGNASFKQPGGDDLPFVFSGTLIVAGRGIARVIAIGINTQIGKIGKALETIPDEKTSLKKETDRIVTRFASIGLLYNRSCLFGGL